ncbi:MAG: DNA adenine methylase [Terriglobia bacterium]
MPLLRVIVSLPQRPGWPTDRHYPHPPLEVKQACRSLTVAAHRKWCGRQDWRITGSYGGYYFSALQAVWLDALRRTLPKSEPQHTVALAALIRAASECAASPGHTAQPFQPTRTAKRFLMDAWGKDIVGHCRDALVAVSKQYAKVRGNAEVRDANEAAKSIRKGELVFVDPPYSGVHYSRFYHVLETLTRGQCGEISGAGRYPPRTERPWSRYSVKSESVSALDELFATVRSRGAKVIVTFPQRMCSNGLSGRRVSEIARKHFAVEQHWVASKFSTLGGNNDRRDARHLARELILVLRP